MSIIQEVNVHNLKILRNAISAIRLLLRVLNSSNKPEQYRIIDYSVIYLLLLLLLQSSIGTLLKSTTLSIRKNAR